MLITLEINGVEYEVREDEPILKICQKFGISVPHLCYLKGMSPSGKCGLCAIEFDDGQIALSCLMRSRSGMKITTSSEKLTEIRRNSIERMLKTHNIDCFNCQKCGVCTLQNYALKTNLGRSSCKNVQGNLIPQYSQIKLRENLFFDKSKCIHCTRCIKFLSKICDIDLATIESLGESTKSTDLLCNIIDICPTSALAQRNNKEAIMESLTDKLKTFDISTVFTPEISVSKYNDKIVSISNIDSVWIKNETKFIHNKLQSRKISTTDYSEILKKMSKEITCSSPGKKIFVLGNNIDILTFSYIKHIAQNFNDVSISFDDFNIPRALKKKIGLFNEDLSKMDLSIFVGNKNLTDMYYLNRLAHNLRETLSFKPKELTKITDLEEYERLFYSCHSPYMFIYSDVFKNCNTNNLVNNINNLVAQYENKFNRQLNVKIIPKHMNQILSKYLSDYISIDDLLKNFNRHDVKFIFIAGDLDYKSDYNSIPTIQHSAFCNHKLKIQEHLRSKHFLEDSGFYINIFGKIVKTEKIISTNLISNNGFLFDLLSEMYGSNFFDINEEIQQELQNVFFK